MIAVLVPTRGFTFTQTDIFIDQIRDYFDLKVVRTYEEKIPEAHNTLVKQALETKADLLFFLEEDVVPTREQFISLVNRDADIGFIDYSVNGWACATTNARGTVLWCGMGCTLIKRKVFAAMQEPWFRNDQSLRLNDMQWIDAQNKYGGHDIWFGDQARRAGFSIIQVPGECKHLQIVSLGQPGVNDGRHQIIQRPLIEKHNILEYEL
jgi:hypothetical protein